MKKLILPVPEDFSFNSTLYSHGWIDLAPFAYINRSDTIRYKFFGQDETVTDLKITWSEQHFLELSYDHGEEMDIRSTVKRIFRLDEDLSEFYDLIDGIPDLQWIREKGAGRMLRSGSLWEDLVKMLFTTNCSWAMTRHMVNNIMEKIADGKAFPTPAMIAAHSETFLREKVRLGYRAPYVHALAWSVVEGKADLAEIENWQSTEESLFRRLLGIKGIGPYAAGSLMKLLGHYQRTAPDSWSRKKFMQFRGHTSMPGDAEISVYYEPFGKWAGLVFWLEMTKTWYFQSEVFT